MRIVLTSLLVAAAVLGGVFFWLNHRPDRPDDVMPTVLAVAEVPDDQPADVPEAPTEPLQRMEETGGEKQFAKHITSVPGDPGTEPEPGRPFDFEFQESVRKMVESAFTGAVGWMPRLTRSSHALVILNRVSPPLRK